MKLIKCKEDFGKKQILFLILILVLMTNCEPEMEFDPSNKPLPAATSIGLNTFGFLLDGKTWLPYNAVDINHKAISVVMDKDSVFMFSINLVNETKKRNESVKIFLSCNKPGPCVPIGFTFVDNNKKIGCQVYNVDASDLKFEISKIDFKDQIISGRFEAKGVKSICGDDKFNIKQSLIVGLPNKYNNLHIYQCLKFINGCS